MSDNYKVIRETKIAIKHLLDIQGWTVNQVVNEIGVTHNLVNEITTMDPVSVKIRDVTMDKLRAFVNKFGKNDGIEKPIRKGSVRTAPKVDEFSAPVPESMQGSIPEDRGIQEAPGSTRGSGNDLMDKLNALCSEFKMKGWSLEVKLSKIFIP